jgi:hypothetical protein
MLSAWAFDRGRLHSDCYRDWRRFLRSRHCGANANGGRLGVFRRLKGFRRIFSRFEKLDVMFVGFIHFALIVEGLRFLC